MPWTASGRAGLERRRFREIGPLGLVSPRNDSVFYGSDEVPEINPSSLPDRALLSHKQMVIPV